MNKKIVFESLGLATNPLFIDIGNGEPPIPYGVIADFHNGPDFWRENYMHDVFTEEQILEAYEKQFKEKGVIINDVSKEAWLEGRFGEQKC